MSLAEILKEAYDIDFPYPHKHRYTKRVSTPIYKPVYSSEADRRYGEDPFTAHRWHGALKQVGENVFMVCNVCDKTKDTVSKLKKLFKGLKYNKNPYLIIS